MKLMNVIFAEIVIRILLLNDDASVWKSTLRLSLGKFFRQWTGLNFSSKIVTRSIRRDYDDRVSFLVIVSGSLTDHKKLFSFAFGHENKQQITYHLEIPK